MWFKRDKDAEIAVLKEGVKQQTAEIEGLRARVEQQKREIEGLKAQLTYTDGIVESQCAALRVGGRRFLNHAPTQDEQERMRNLAVPLENPILQAVVSVLHELEKDAVSNITIPHKHRFERDTKVDLKEGFYDGVLYGLICVQERLLEIREEGMKKAHSTNSGHAHSKT